MLCLIHKGRKEGKRAAQRHRGDAGDDVEYVLR